MTSTEIKLSQDPLGYFIGSEFVSGLVFDSRLNKEQLHKLIIWAEALQPENVDKLEEHFQKFEVETVDDRDVKQSIYWQFLDDQEKKLISEQDVKYPLSAGKFADLVDISIDQVRYWTAAGLLPVEISEGGHRRFEMKAAATALIIRKLSSNQLAVVLAVEESGAQGLAETLLLADLLLKKKDDVDQDVKDKLAGAIQQLSETVSD